MDKKAGLQYFCAILLIISSICLAFIVSLSVGAIETSILIYIAQAFLLAASIFGLDYYVRKLFDIIEAKSKLDDSRVNQN